MSDIEKRQNAASFILSSFPHLNEGPAKNSLLHVQHTGDELASRPAIGLANGVHMKIVNANDIENWVRV